MDPAFLAMMHFPLKRRDSFLYFGKPVLKRFGVATYYIFFKREKKIRKTLNVTLDKKRRVWEKLSPNSEVMLPIGKVW